MRGHKAVLLEVIAPHSTVLQLTLSSACSDDEHPHPLEMRVRTLEIRWHDSKPISACDFQPVPFKKARPTQDKNFVGQSYKLATGGEDNHVRVRSLCLAWWETRTEGLALTAVDGASEYHAPVGPGDRWRRCDGTACTESRIPCNAEQTLGGCQCRPLESQWYALERVFEE